MTMIALASGRVLLVALALVCFGETASRAVGARSSAPRAEDYAFAGATPTTSSPGDNLEDPSNALATAAEVPDDYCFRCSDKVTVAENLIAVHTNLLAKKKALVRKKAAAAASAPAATPPKRAANASPRSNADEPASLSANNIRRPSPTMRNRTLEYPPPPPPLAPAPAAPASPAPSSMSVISRLLVVRSATLTEQPPPPAIISDTTTTTTTPPPPPTISHKNKLGRNKKSPALSLDRLQHELDHQWNATCDALLEVRVCVRELAPTCIGDLQFHSLETWSYQELSKFSCPIEKGSRVKPWPALNTRYYKYLDQPAPVARPVTSPEAIRERLGQMFPNGAIRPPGVVLRPTVNANQNSVSTTTTTGGIGGHKLTVAGVGNHYNPNVVDRRRLFNTIVTWGVFVFAGLVSVASVFVFISRAANREELGLDKK